MRLVTWKRWSDGAVLEQGNPPAFWRLPGDVIKVESVPDTPYDAGIHQVRAGRRRPVSDALDLPSRGNVRRSL